jgi:undecaprenyl-diphosphatase
MSQTNFLKDFEIIIQLGAILAIVFLYWGKVKKSKEIWKKILTAFIPTGIIGFLLFKLIKEYLLGNLYITLAALFIGGILLIIIELIHKEKDYHTESIEDITYKNAFIIGASQSLAVIPGVSRSAATIISALILGTKRKTATEFSFLLAVPTMLAATVLDLTKNEFSHSASEWLMLILGFISAFFFAVISVKWFLKYIQNHSFIFFGIYRIVLSILFFLFLIK